MPQYDSVLFDNDGIIVSPPDYETQMAAIREAFAACGVADVPRGHVEDLIRGVTVERLTEIAAHHDVDPERLWTAREEHDERAQFDEFDAGSRGLYDDVPAVFDALDHPVGVVSSNHHTTVEHVLDRFDLAGHVDTYYGRPMTVQSIDRKKPNTFYLDRAMTDLDADAALYVGDSPTDVQAAHAAGMDSLFVRRDHNRDVDLDVTPTWDRDSLDVLLDLVE